MGKHKDDDPLGDDWLGDDRPVDKDPADGTDGIDYMTEDDLERETGAPEAEDPDDFEEEWDETDEEWDEGWEDEFPEPEWDAAPRGPQIDVEAVQGILDTTVEGKAPKELAIIAAIGLIGITGGAVATMAWDVVVNAGSPAALIGIASTGLGGLLTIVGAKKIGGS